MPKRFKFKETEGRAHARWGDLKMGRLAEGNSTAWNIIVEHSS
jgi:hypothetical protein